MRAILFGGAFRPLNPSPSKHEIDHSGKRTLSTGRSAPYSSQQFPGRALGVRALRQALLIIWPRPPRSNQGEIRPSYKLLNHERGQRKEATNLAAHLTSRRMPSTRSAKLNAQSRFGRGAVHQAVLLVVAQKRCIVQKRRQLQGWFCCLVESPCSCRSITIPLSNTRYRPAKREAKEWCFTTPQTPSQASPRSRRDATPRDADLCPATDGVMPCHQAVTRWQDLATNPVGGYVP